MKCKHCGTQLCGNQYGYYHKREKFYPFKEQNLKYRDCTVPEPEV